MKTISIISIIMIAVVLLLTGLAVGFQVGRDSGFKVGSEWALVQADLLAREAGVFMPVHLSEDGFRIVMRQPPGLYKRAWQLADKYDKVTGKLKTTELQNADREGACKNVVLQAKF